MCGVPKKINLLCNAWIKSARLLPCSNYSVDATAKIAEL